MCIGGFQMVLVVKNEKSGSLWSWEGPLGTPLGLVQWPTWPNTPCSRNLLQAPGACALLPLPGSMLSDFCISGFLSLGTVDISGRILLLGASLLIPFC